MLKIVEISPGISVKESDSDGMKNTRNVVSSFTPDILNEVLQDILSTNINEEPDGIIMRPYSTFFQGDYILIAGLVCVLVSVFVFL